MQRPCSTRSLQWAAICAPFFIVSAQGLSAGELTVRMTDLPSDAGRARLVIVDSERAYRGKDKPVQIVAVPIKGGKAAWNVKTLPEGKYALIAHHDRNSNNELDRPIFGLPVEAYGFANKAWATFGVPTWQDASFDVGPNPVAVEVRVRLNPIVGWSLAALRLWPVWLIFMAVCGALFWRRRRST